jgi:hypothetical protein
MNAKKISSSLLGTLLLSFGMFACAAETTDEANANDPAVEDLTSGQKQITGAWHVGPKAFDSSEAYVFHTDGTFIHDQFRILNGVLIAGGPPPGRDMGTFTVNKSKGTVTLHVKQGWHTGETQVYNYTYTPAKIMNGVYLPGAEPEATLDLQKPAPTNGSKIAYPTVRFTAQDSYCSGLPNVSTNDCEIQRNEQTWLPSGKGKSICNVQKNVCETK